MPARSVCLVTLFLSEAGPGRFVRQVSVTDIYHTIPAYYFKGLGASAASYPSQTSTIPWHGFCYRRHNRMRPVFGTSFICAFEVSCMIVVWWALHHAIPYLY